MESNSTQAVFWVETKGRTIEEIDALFEDRVHSTVHNIEDVRKGREVLDVGKLENELKEEAEMKQKFA